MEGAGLGKEGVFSYPAMRCAAVADLACKTAPTFASLQGIEDIPANALMIHRVFNSVPWS